MMGQVRQHSRMGSREAVEPTTHLLPQRVARFSSFDHAA